ncbi:hypothetical protein [Haloactinomyces albus]|uniref:Xanthine/uracil/vitamin C permease (AzgA family) n=1 Tax=Haloactinomyces albus TaxID=1352928 RepID=A0AAE3ZFR6_9ACTN|nr:hypothetical protein [Haloactinomyces albus]MDR7304131.1 xanthine/uracil/vitamin C permease (AzgA family) [Haloactinomyces albus]
MTDGTVESAASTSDALDEKKESRTAATLFDIRMVIGGLFLVYGLLLSGAGMFPTEQGLEKAQGVNINLWTGLAMLAVSGAFLLWLKLRPLNPRAVDKTA